MSLRQFIMIGPLGVVGIFFGQGVMVRSSDSITLHILTDTFLCSS